MNRRSSYYRQDLSYDCSEIADDLYEASGGKGRIYEITPNKGDLIVQEYGIKENFVYHQVYSDGVYIFDPRYSSIPMLEADYFKMLNSLNPSGFTIK